MAQLQEAHLKQAHQQAVSQIESRESAVTEGELQLASAKALLQVGMQLHGVDPVMVVIVVSPRYFCGSSRCQVMPLVAMPFIHKNVPDLPKRAEKDAILHPQCQQHVPNMQ